jgi:galactokinase
MSFADRMNEVLDKCVDQAVARERARGNAARMRAAGMGALLVEIRAHNAARDLDEELLDRIDRAIADHERAIDAHFAEVNAGVLASEQQRKDP